MSGMAVGAGSAMPARLAPFRISGKLLDAPKRGVLDLAAVIPMRPRDEEKIEAGLVEHLVVQARGGLTGFLIGTMTVVAVVVVLWDAAPRTVLFAWVAS